MPVAPLSPASHKPLLYAVRKNPDHTCYYYYTSPPSCFTFTSFPMASILNGILVRGDMTGGRTSFLMHELRCAGGRCFARSYEKLGNYFTISSVEQTFAVMYYLFLHRCTKLDITVQESLKYFLKYFVRTDPLTD